jgi:hypothetical protein
METNQETTVTEVTETPKAPAAKAKKVQAPKVEVKVAETAAKVTTKVSDAAKSSVNAVKDSAIKVTTKVSDATKSSVDSVKDVFSDIEVAIKDARESGNANARKMMTTIFKDNANETVVDVVAYIGEAGAVCMEIGCAPMVYPVKKANDLFKKLTA